VFYTVTKDNIHLVWETSRVGEFPADSKFRPDEIAKIRHHGINSPFEEAAISQDLNSRGIHAVYVRAIYVTGSLKVEMSVDPRRYRSHQDIVDIDGNPVLAAEHNYITIRGYYNGPDEWVPENEDQLLKPVDLVKAVHRNLINKKQSRDYLDMVIARLEKAGYDGSLLKANDLLLAVNARGEIVKDRSGEPDLIICNFETLWKTSGAA